MSDGELKISAGRRERDVQEGNGRELKESVIRARLIKMGTGERRKMKRGWKRGREEEREKRDPRMEWSTHFLSRWAKVGQRRAVDVVPPKRGEIL